LFYDQVGAAAGIEWIEIYNPGDTFVDLSNYSVGSGGTDYTSNTLQLGAVTIAPKGTVVIGGPTSDAANYSPDFAQAIDTGGFQNGGAESDGVALFFGQASSIMATTRPIDKVVYDSPNTNDLIGEDGMPVAMAELSPDVPEGSVLIRGTSMNDLFVERAAGNPNLPIMVTAVSPTRGPNESRDLITIDGYGFDEDLDVVTLGTTTLTCIGTIDQLLCELPMSVTDTGLVDLTITRTMEFVPDGAGDPMMMAIPAPNQKSFTLADAFFLEGQKADPGGTFYCGTIPPTTSTVMAGNPITVEVRVFVDGATVGPTGSVPAGYVVQGGFFTRGVNPFETFDVNWITTTTNRDDPSGSNNELYEVTFTSATARTAEVGFRISDNNGTDWIYCDTDGTQVGSENGWQTGGGVDIEWN